MVWSFHESQGTYRNPAPTGPWSPPAPSDLGSFKAPEEDWRLIVNDSADTVHGVVQSGPDRTGIETRGPEAAGAHRAS